MGKNTKDQQSIKQDKVKKEDSSTPLTTKISNSTYGNDANKIFNEYENVFVDKNEYKSSNILLKSSGNTKIEKEFLKTKKTILSAESKKSEVLNIKKDQPIVKDKVVVKSSAQKNQKVEDNHKPSLIKTEDETLAKDISPEKREKIIKSYDHTQPIYNFKHSRDYKRLRTRTLSGMKKKEKAEVSSQKDPIAKNIFQEIYDNKWKKNIQPNSADHVINIKNVRKYFVNGTTAEYILKKINIKIKNGEIFVILGASGSGKTTLLNIISGLIDASSGDVIVKNKNLFVMNEKDKIKFRAENVSFVFQSYNLIPSLTVEENIKVGASLRSKNTEKISVKEIMELLNLYDQRNKYPFQLSGGQNQRVSIGRALSKNPKILFADEPTGALDEERGKEALKFLVDINEKYGTTIIMVTHNPNFKWIGDSTLRIHDGQVESLTHNAHRINPKDIKWT